MAKYSEIKLPSFDVILAATQGDTSALHKVVEHYDGYIAKLCMRSYRGKNGDYYYVDFAIIQAIIDARKSKGITQKELSRRTGIAQGDISKLENGNGNPSIKTLQRLAAAMDMSLKIEFIAN